LICTRFAEKMMQHRLNLHWLGFSPEPGDWFQYQVH
jgi:hypothetical protein